MHIGKIYEDAESWASSNHVTPRTSFPAASRRILAFGEDVQDGKYKFLTTISDSDYDFRFDFSVLLNTTIESIYQNMTNDVGCYVAKL